MVATEGTRVELPTLQTVTVEVVAAEDRYGFAGNLLETD